MTAVLHLDRIAGPLVLEAGALAEKGVIDPETVECVVCGVPAIVHFDQEDRPGGHLHQEPAPVALARAALASADRAVMDDIVEHQAAGYVPSGKTGPRVSDAGACRRQIQYRDRPPVDYMPRTDIDLRRAALGKLIHAAGEQARGTRYPWKRHELEIPIPGLDRPGRVDEYDPVLGEVADTKSAGRAKWDVVGEGGPTDDMWQQVRIYGFALDALGLPVRTLRIVAINRDTGAEESFFEDYDPGKGLAALDELVTVATAIDAGLDMPRDGNGPSDWRCQWCSALNHCWNTDQAAQLGRSPRSLTLLGEEPDDPSIIWAALELMRVAAARLALDKQEKLAQELIEGLPARAYGPERADGGVELYNKWSTGRAYKQAYEQLVGLYALALDGDPKAPAVDTLPEVPTTKSKKTAVRRPKREADRKPRKKKTTPGDAAAAVVAALTEGTGPA